MEELAYRSARSIAAGIRSGEFTSREVLEAMLERIERLDGPLNTVVTLDAERARHQADAADAALRAGEPTGPLHGVCMTIKDSFQTQGMRTTSGAPELADFVPEVDAAPVARLRGAGAVIVGKTNLPIYAGDTQSYNEVFGQTNNPYDLSRTVGGSSGGSAGALAAGFTPLEVGSDIGGSIRGPASTCGVTGHKPSYGIVSALGQIPGPPGTRTQADIAVAGPLARDVEDLELALDLLVGPDEWHSPAYRIELPPPRKRELSDYRIAAWFDEPSCPVDREVAALLEQAAKALAGTGARVDLDARPAFEFEKGVSNFQALLSAALAGGFSRDQLESLAAREGDDPVAVASRAAAIRHREWLSSNERRLQLRQRWHEFFQEWDAVLLPVLPTAAIPHDHSEPMALRTITVNGDSRPYADQMKWVGLVGAAYLPATVVPIGLTSDGLPVGVQIAGPFLEDRTTLDVGRGLYELMGGFRRPAGY
jgi:amidase